MMKFATGLTLALSLSLGAAACKKKEEAPKAKPTAGSGSATAGSGSATAGSATTPAGSGSATAGSAAAGSGSADAGSGSAAVAPADDKADKLVATIDHTEAAKGPVDVTFGIKVVKADFDPAKIEGGTATLELDIGSLSTGNPKRDDHLKSGDYFDATKFAVGTIEISNVKKADAGFTADAKVKVRDMEKTYPVTFEVVETLPDGSIRVKGERTFSRNDFGIGKAEGDSAATDVTAKLQLTLKKS
jgi:polyisoprenoid-binding protein YceI